jgi:hypothetical protein
VPVYLPAPEPDRRGPDGKGRNGLRIESIWLDECALRPTSWQTLWIAQTDTRRAWYGNFGPCGRTGRCGGCAVWEAPPLACRDHGHGSGRMLARLDPRRRDPVWLMVNPDLGWESYGYRWTWAQLARLRGWQADRGHVDEHGEGFWLRRVPVAGTVRRRLPLTWLVAARDAVAAALASGDCSPAPDRPIPARCRWGPDGLYEVRDGLYRVAAAIRRGERTIDADIDPVPSAEPLRPPFWDFAAVA